MFLVCINNVKDRFAHHIHILYDHNFHRFFLLNGWNVFNPSIAFRTERIDIYPILATNDNLFQLPAHVTVLHIRQHALEYAEVHARSD